MHWRTGGVAIEAMKYGFSTTNLPKVVALVGREPLLVTVRLRDAQQKIARWGLASRAKGKPMPGTVAVKVGQALPRTGCSGDKND